MFNFMTQQKYLKIRKYVLKYVLYEERVKNKLFENNRLTTATFELFVDK